MADTRMQRYKVLGAAHVLQSFTVEDVNRYSNVAPATIQKVLSREQKDGFIEPVGRMPAKGRGTPPMKYRVAPSKAKDLETLLTTLQMEVQSFVPTVPSVPYVKGVSETNPLTGIGVGIRVTDAALPSALLPTASTTEDSTELQAVEYLLLDKLPNAMEETQRREIVRQAQQVWKAEKERLQSAALTLSPRALVVDSMLELASLSSELAHVEEPRARPFYAYQKPVADIMRAVRNLPESYTEDVVGWLNQAMRNVVISPATMQTHPERSEGKISIGRPRIVGGTVIPPLEHDDRNEDGFLEIFGEGPSVSIPITRSDEEIVDIRPFREIRTPLSPKALDAAAAMVGDLGDTIVYGPIASAHLPDLGMVIHELDQDSSVAGTGGVVYEKFITTTDLPCADDADSVSSLVDEIITKEHMVKGS